MTSATGERRGVRIAGWVLIGALPALILAACEVGVRLWNPRSPAGPRRSVPAWLDRNVQAKESEWITLLDEHPGDLSRYYSTYAWDRRLFYRVRPHLEITLTDVSAAAAIRERTRWTFHTNDRGYNSRDIPYEKAAGVFRIVTLGDSSTFGWGVPPEAAYPRRLEALMRDRHGDRVEVINLGVCGYSSLQGRVLMETEALRYHPDIVTLSFGSNDFSLVHEPFDVVLARNLGWTGALREWLHASRAYEYAVDVFAALNARGGGDAGTRDPEGVLNVGPEKSRANLVAMDRRARELGIDPIFVSNCARDPIGIPIREAAAETDAPLLDTEGTLDAAVAAVLSGEDHREDFERLRALYGERLLGIFPWLAVYLGDHCHPNVIGHDLIARRLVPMVEGTAAFAAWRRASGSTGGQGTR